MNALMKRNNCNNLRPSYDRFFNDFFREGFPSMFFDAPLKAEKMFRSMPTANISENDNAFEVDLVAPGYDKENLKIALEDEGKTLLVKAEINQKSDENESENAKNDNVFHREHYYASFERSFSLPEIVDVENISASYKRGVLKINLPKKQKEESAAPKNIEIQ